MIRIDAQPEQRELLVLHATNRPAAGIRVLIDDPKAIAAAAPLRVIENPENDSGADASVAWQPDQRDALALRSITSFPQAVTGKRMASRSATPRVGRSLSPVRPKPG